MKIQFDEKGKNYLEVDKTQDNQIKITISAMDGKNPKQRIINSAEISTEEWQKIVDALK